MFVISTDGRYADRGENMNVNGVRPDLPSAEPQKTSRGVPSSREADATHKAQGGLHEHNLPHHGATRAEQQRALDDRVTASSSRPGGALGPEGPELSFDALRLFADTLAPIVGAAVVGICRWAADTWPESPSGWFVPAPNRRLFVRARRTYRGDHNARAELFDLLGVKGLTADDLLVLDTLLSPTFNPLRPDKRKAWELMPLADAKLYLANRLAKLAKEEREKLGRGPGVLVNPVLLEGPIDGASHPRGVLDPDLEMFLLEERVKATLPQQHAQVAWFGMEEYVWERRSETTALVAERIEKDASTVRRIKGEIRKNPQFRREFRAARWEALMNPKKFLPGVHESAKK